MASYTPNLNLYKKDPIADGNDFFNIKTMMNDNWDKIDDSVKAALDDIEDLQSEQVRIATGSYVGTGTYGASNPCSLTFDFVPIIFLVVEETANEITTGYIGQPGNKNSILYQVSGTSIVWRTVTGVAANQRNESGVRYFYIAIG